MADLAGHGTDIIRMWIGSAMNTSDYAVNPLIGAKLSIGKASLGTQTNTWLKGPVDVDYTYNQWNTLGMEFDCDEQTLRFYLNGKEIFTERQTADKGKPLKFARDKAMSIWSWAFYKNIYQGHSIKFKEFEFWSVDDKDFRDTVESITYASLTDENRDSITKDITLPTLFKKADGDITVQWSSSNEDVISSSGKVTQSDVCDKEVTLTALVEQEDTGFADVLTFTFNVIRRDVDKFVFVERSEFSAASEMKLIKAEGSGSVKIENGSLRLENTKAGDTVSAIKQIGAAGIALDGSVYLDIEMSGSGANTFSVLDSEGSEVLSGSLKAGEYTIGSVSFAAGSGTRLNLAIDTGAKKAVVYEHGVKKGEIPISGANVAQIVFGVTGQGALDVSYLECAVKTDDPDLKRVQLDSAALQAEDLTDELPEYITSDMSFAMITQGMTGSTVTWSSGKPSIISNAGVVTRPAETEQVVLTAAFRSGGEELTKTFNLTVIGTEDENLSYGASVRASSEQAGCEAINLADADASNHWLAKEEDSEPWVIVYLGGEKTVSAVVLSESGSAVKGFVIETSADNKSWTRVYSGKSVGGETKAVFNSTSAAYVRYAVTEKDEGATGLSRLEIRYIRSAREAVEQDAADLKISDSGTVTKDLTLPTEGANGTVIKWQSSNTDVISNTGKVTLPSGGDRRVTLTATISKDGYSAEKRIQLTVPGRSGGSSGGLGGSGSSGRPSGGVNLGGSGNGAASSVTGGLTDPKKDTETKMFRDVSKDAWSYDYIRRAYEAGVVNGDENGCFNPETAVTREEFVKMLVIALGLKTEFAEHNFSDVESGAWYEKYVAAAFATDVVKGITDTSFGIGMNITRQDASVITDRALTAVGKPVDTAEEMYYSDKNAVADYAQKSVARLSAAEIICGSDGMFAPKDNLTREQAAKIICLVMDR